MADPLSIAASVVGLVAAASKICSALSGFVSSAVDAPQSAQHVLTVVSDTRLALEMVQELIDAIAVLPGHRKMLVRLDHLAVTFSNCVLTISELESLVSLSLSVDGGGGGGKLRRFKWIRNEQKVLRLLPRLESQKASLSLMISVLRCQSEVEALASRDKLNAAVEQILQRDEEFAERMRQIDGEMDLMITDRSVRFHDSESIAVSHRLSMAAGPSRNRDSVVSLRGWQPTTLENRREFEAILEQSRVYTRTSSNEVDGASLASSNVRSHAWSMLSLNDISIIAVFRLPVTLDDIVSFGPNLTLGGFFGENFQQSNTTETTAETQTDIKNDMPTSSNNEGVPRPPIQSAPFPDAVQSIKAVMVGDKSCEKTRIAISFTSNANPGDFIPTVFDNYSASLMIRGRPYSLGIWDTSGQEEYERLRPLAYPQTDVFLVFGRIGIKSTFDSIANQWIPEITHHTPGVPILIVGVSTGDDDQLFELARQRREPHQHEDYTKMGKSLAKQFGAVKYMECSLSTLHNLKEVFSEAALAAISPSQGERQRKSKLWRPGFLRGIGETKEE